MNRVTYFVVGDSCSPIKICFDLETAKKAGGNYIDSFDEGGELVDTWVWDADSCKYVQETKCGEKLND